MNNRINKPLNVPKSFDSAFGLKQKSSGIKKIQRAIPYRKIAVLNLMFVVLVTACFPFVRSTLAYFSDSATSMRSEINSGRLSFDIISETGFEPSGITPGDGSSRNVRMVNTGNLDFKYKVEANNFSSSDLCDVLELRAYRDDDMVFRGRLDKFDVGPFVFSEPENWVFSLTLPLSAGEEALNEECRFDLEFVGWQINLPNKQSGFSHVEELGNFISSGSHPNPSSGDIIINEFMPWPENESHMPGSEWVELYNPSETDSVDVEGWKIRDSKDNQGSHYIEIRGCLTNTGSTVIPPNGFLAVYAKGSPGCNSKGFQINNKEDVIRLFNSDILVDSYEYPDPGVCDADETCGQTKRGQTYAQVPDGSGNWVITSNPTPGLSNGGSSTYTLFGEAEEEPEEKAETEEVEELEEAVRESEFKESEPINEDTEQEIEEPEKTETESAVEVLQESKAEDVV